MNIASRCLEASVARWSHTVALRYLCGHTPAWFMMCCPIAAPLAHRQLLSYDVLIIEVCTVCLPSTDINSTFHSSRSTHLTAHLVVLLPTACICCQLPATQTIKRTRALSAEPRLSSDLGVDKRSAVGESGESPFRLTRCTVKSTSASFDGILVHCHVHTLPTPVSDLSAMPSRHSSLRRNLVSFFLRRNCPPPTVHHHPQPVIRHVISDRTMHSVMARTS